MCILNKNSTAELKEIHVNGTDQENNKSKIVL